MPRSHPAPPERAALSRQVAELVKSFGEIESILLAHRTTEARTVRMSKRHGDERNSAHRDGGNRVHPWC